MRRFDPRSRRLRSRALATGLGRHGHGLGWLVLPASALAALLVGGGMLAALGASPLTGYRALLDGAFGGGYALSATAVKAVPLLLVGVGICIAFRANVFNIGGEGQIAMGALAATVVALALPDLPVGVLIPLTLVAGAVGGGVWGAIPGAFKGYLNVNEILSTIMLNLVAVQVMNYCLSGPLRDRTSGTVGGLIPQTRLLPESSWLPILWGGTQLHLGVAIAVLIAIAVYILLWRTGFGFRIRAVGLSRDAATYAGMPVARTTMLALTLSGAMCGVAGSMLVFGSISHRMVTDGSLTGFTGSAGFNGIVVALFAGLNPLWTILSSFIFAGLLVGGDAMQVATGVPSDLVVSLNGLVVIFVVSTEIVRRRRRVAAEPTDSGGPALSEPASSRVVEAPT